MLVTGSGIAANAKINPAAAFCLFIGSVPSQECCAERSARFLNVRAAALDCACLCTLFFLYPLVRPPMVDGYSGQHNSASGTGCSSARAERFRRALGISRPGVVRPERTNLEMAPSGRFAEEAHSQSDARCSHPSRVGM